MFKDKSKEERGVNELLQKQQYEIQELEKKILVQQSSVGDKNSELSALKQQLAQERNRYMTDVCNVYFLSYWVCWLCYCIQLTLVTNMKESVRVLGLGF